MQIKRFDSSDTHVFKYVFDTADAIFEAVAYRYPDWNTRTVICCSVQSGCPVGCTFCGSGGKFIRNLTDEEIIHQIQHIIADQGIESDDIAKFQIMFMSMGEPLLNPKHTESAIRKLNLMYPNAQLLISTVLPDVSTHWIMNLAKEIDQVGIQISLHASTEEVRAKLIPAKLKGFDAIEWHGWDFKGGTNRQIFLNYCVTEENSAEEDADRIQAAFPPECFQFTCSVVCEKDETVQAAHEGQRELCQGFMEKLLKRGYSVRMFDPGGQNDIGGGCGQLWYVQKWMKENA